MEIMRIKEDDHQGKKLWLFKKYSLLEPNEMYIRVWRIWILMSGCKGLNSCNVSYSYVNLCKIIPDYYNKGMNR